MSNIEHNLMIGVGNSFPTFNMQAIAPLKSSELTTDNAFINISQEDYKNKWLIVFFYPKDFTPICNTELVHFSKLHEEFSKRNTQLIGGSTDSDFVHLAWRRHEQDLANINFPLFSDITRELSTKLGILNHKAGVAYRATYIVDDKGIIRHASVNDISVGRNSQEILRILDALQTGGFCGCDWQKGEETLQVK